MLTRNTIFRLVGLALLLLPVTARALQANSSTCRQYTERALAGEERRLRAVLFGMEKAQDAPVNAVRFDRDGQAWTKVDDAMWANAEGRSRTNARMEAEAESPPRRGIFETRRTLTSDLVPYVTQAYRTFKCRTLLVCRTVELSLEQKDADPRNITVGVPGCTQETVMTVPACHLAAAQVSPSEIGDQLTYCRKVQADLVQRERELVRMAVEYDAAYRSFLQLSGGFDAFLQEFRWPIMNSLRKALQLIGSLHRIPCFLGSCDGAPPPTQP